MDKKEIKTTIAKALNPQLIAEGFQLHKKSTDWVYTKKTDVGYNKVWLLFYHYPPIYFTGVALAIRINAINAHYNHLVDVNPDYHSETSTITAKPTDFGYENDRIKIETATDLLKAIDWLKQFLFVDAKQFFSQYASIDAIDKDLNRENRREKYVDVEARVKIGLIAGKLNNNEQFQGWQKNYEQQYSHTDWFKKLKKYLDNEM